MTDATYHFRQQPGFTLIQIMAILGVLGLVLTVATSSYLKHQSKHYIKEALVEAGHARQVVAQNVKSNADDNLKDWSKGYSPKTGENNAWSVYIDPASAAVVVSLLTTKEPATLLWVPLKNSQSKDESNPQEGKILNEDGLNWVCVVKDNAIPDSMRLFAPLSASVPKPGMSDDWVSADCH
jgi:type II secretory pathway pseudopilin PulG